MNSQKNKKLYNQWWFWVILAFIFLIFVSIIFPNDCDCETFKVSDCPECEVSDCSECEVSDCSQPIIEAVACEYELNSCEEQTIELVDAWNDYLDSFEEYCEIDYTNILCLTLPQR